MTPQPLLTVDEAAARLAVSRRTVYNLVARGALEATHVGSLIRIDPAAIERFLRAHRIQIAAPPEPVPVPVRVTPAAGTCASLPGATRYRM